MEAIVVAFATSMNGGTHVDDLGRANARPSRPTAPGKVCVEVNLHEDDLREIALRGYEGAASSDRTRQAEAVSGGRR
jgi:hypothetical protein